MTRYWPALALIAFWAYAFLVEESIKPSLTLRVSPQIGMAGPPKFYAPITIYARIEGKMNQAFYCPQITFFWPDGTKAIRESDCEPYEEGEEGERAWDMTRGFPAGDWEVVVELSKAGKTIARQTAKVKVVE